MTSRWIPLLLIIALAGCAGETDAPEPDGVDVAGNVRERLERFVPTELRVNLEALPDSERQALAHLVRAADYMDDVFLRQVWRGNPELEDALRELDGATSEAARTYFAVNYGPWDRLEELEPFVGDSEHPAGAGYYPEGLTQEAFEAWLEENPPDREAFTSLTTVIRRQDPKLVAIPYSAEYAEWLTPAAEALRAAARATSNDSLREFLELRAAAFLSDDYYASDIAWMDLDSLVEATIGPYETYEDSLFGYKAAFEAFVTLALPEESAALERYKNELPWLERNLPIPDEHKNFDRGTESPIRVADVLLTAGDARAGVQTLAFNLPNDERVREEKGSKKVMLRNVIRAKYEKVLVPIAERVLTPEGASRVDFGAYFDEILHHELSHGLGPGKITLDGRDTEVRLELKELYSTLEEAKADVMGVYDILALIDKGEMPAELGEALLPTYVAGLFRSARFGLHEAHGRGVVSQFNYLLERGALGIDEAGRFYAVAETFADGIRDLLNELLMIQATGDYARASEFLGTYGVATPALEAAVTKLEDVPVDIRPIYPDAESLRASG